MKTQQIIFLKSMSKKIKSTVVLSLFLIITGCQTPYPYYEPNIASPAYSTPTILFDASHSNLHQITGTFAPLAKLLRSDGYQVKETRVPYPSDCLTTISTNNCEYYEKLVKTDIFIIPHTREAVSREEAILLKGWVFNGGSLLVITDHPPYIGNITNLLEELGLKDTQPDFVTNDNLLAENGFWDLSHPVITGRNAGEQVNIIIGNGGTGLRLDNSGSTSTSIVEPRFLVMNNQGDIGHTAILEYGAGRVVVVVDGAPMTEQFDVNFIEFDPTIDSDIDAWFNRFGGAITDACDFTFEDLVNADNGFPTDPARFSALGCLDVIAKRQCQHLGIAEDQCKENLPHFGLTQGDNQQYVLNIIHWLDRQLAE